MIDPEIFSFELFDIQFTVHWYGVIIAAAVVIGGFITEREIARLHSQEWIDQVKRTQWWRVSLYSVGGMLGQPKKS